jgi:hypothetical protein
VAAVRLPLVFVLLVAVAAALPAHAQGSRYVRYGLQDDAWLEYGPGTLETRLDRLDAMGVDLVRLTLDWDRMEARRGSVDWARADALLRGLHAHGIEPVVTLYGSPRWSNGGRAPRWAPTNGGSFASFARRVATRYPFVRRYVVWNEPNQARWLRPTSPATYVARLLNPAYAAIHRVRRAALVAGGVTAPRASRGGMSPVDWIAGMKKARAKLDAYAHNPYPLRPGETPWKGGCDHCETITLATLDRLLVHVQRAWRGKRIWLTEYGYQTNPPDRLAGVSNAKQARYTAAAALRAYLAPRVDMLVHYLLVDEPNIGRWQSGFFSARGAMKRAYSSFVLPLAQTLRSGRRTTLWGQVRPRNGRQTYRLQEFRSGRWHAVGGDFRTDRRGFLTRTVRAGAGARFRFWSPLERAFSPIVAVR